MKTRINGILINTGRLTEQELCTAITHAKDRLQAAQRDVNILCNEQDYRVRFGTHPSRTEFQPLVGVGRGRGYTPVPQQMQDELPLFVD